MAFEPCYVWPTNIFPFCHLYSHENLELLFIENLTHNYHWLRKYREHITDRHFFIVMFGWNISDFFAQHCDDMFQDLGLCKQNFFCLFNSVPEAQRLLARGFHGQLINHNIFIDPRTFRVWPKAEKQYRAIMLARQTPFKRHYLARKVSRLALIAGGWNCDDSLQYTLPPHVYNNKTILSRSDVCQKLNESVCGLILSEEEGACYASSEYLLSGIPVVSTHSQGGRDVWYNDYNSVICDPTPEAVAAAVDTLNADRRDPYIIHEMHLAQADRYRQKFISAVQDVFDRYGVCENAQTFLYKSDLIWRIRDSRNSDFDSLFVR